MPAFVCRRSSKQKLAVLWRADFGGRPLEHNYCSGGSLECVSEPLSWPRKETRRTGQPVVLFVQSIGRRRSAETSPASKHNRATASKQERERVSSCRCRARPANRDGAVSSSRAAQLEEELPPPPRKRRRWRRRAEPSSPLVVVINSKLIHHNKLRDKLPLDIESRGASHFPTLSSLGIVCALRPSRRYSSVCERQVCACVCLDATCSIG